MQAEFNADPDHIHQDIRLPGQHHDRATGLYYNRHRYYDPQLGAYVNQDPIGLASGQPNLFAYVSGNPLGATDPTGLLEDFVFDVEQGILSGTCPCISGSASMFSGVGSRQNNPDFEHIAGAGPIPRGRYFIVEPYIYTKNIFKEFGGLTFFKLMPDDGNFSDGREILSPIDNNLVYRDKFRLHPGNVSLGCITTSNIAEWKKIQHHLLNKTKIEFLPNGQPYFGTITVK